MLRSTEAFCPHLCSSVFRGAPTSDLNGALEHGERFLAFREMFRNVLWMKNEFMYTQHINVSWVMITFHASWDKVGVNGRPSS